MTRRTWNFIREPQGDVWRRMLRALGQEAATVSLVLRDDVEVDDGARAVIDGLEPRLVVKTRSASWPGTTLIGHEATVVRVLAAPSVIEALLVASDGLYQWQHPTLPEDLALLREDGSTILGSIAHEHDAFLEVMDAELERLRVTVPEIDELITEN